MRLFTIFINWHSTDWASLPSITLLLIEIFHGKWLFTKSEGVNELSASAYEADFDIKLKWLYKS